MATITHRVTVADTSNTTTYLSGSFTPTAGDLLFAIVWAKAMTATDTTLTASANGITFTRTNQILGDGSGARMILFVADQLVPSSPSSMTVTYDCSSDASSGVYYAVASISGMSKTGSTAVKQFAGTDNNLTLGGTPAVTFGAAVTTTNPVAGAVGNNTNPAGVTEPSGWTEVVDTGNSGPLSGYEFVTRNSGETGTTITWGSTSATRGATVAVEFDASSSGLGGTLGIATETDAAQALGKRKTKAVGIVTETDASQALGRKKQRALGITTETDGAQPIGRRKVKALGTATETDTALPITRLVGSLGGTLGIATESDAAQPLGRSKSKSVGVSTETDSAQPLGRLKRKAVGVVTETDGAQPIGRRKVKALGVATETDEAIEITRLAGIIVEVGTATETDEALAISRTKRKAVGAATEEDGAQAISGGLVTVVYTPPTFEKSMHLWGPHILNYYRLTTAATIVKIDGVFTSIVTPNPGLLVGLTEGEDYFRGGYLYEMTQGQAAVLAAAGFPSG